MEIELRPRAIVDLDEIHSYTLARWDIDQAERYIGQIKAAIMQCATEPTLAVTRSDIARNLLRIRAGSHFIYVRRLPTKIIVIRILHERMDPQRHL